MLAWTTNLGSQQTLIREYIFCIEKQVDFINMYNRGNKMDLPLVSLSSIAVTNHNLKINVSAKMFSSFPLP